MLTFRAGLTITDASGRPKWTYGGDFGEVSHDSNFCINGLLWPDRGLDLRSLYGDRLLPYIGIGSANTFQNYGPANVLPVLSESLTARLLGLQCAQIFHRLDKRRAASFEQCAPASTTTEGLNTLPVKAGGRKHSRVSFSLESNHNPVLRAVQTLVAKPTLLEAKQCMKTFHCTVQGVSHEGGEYDDDSSGFGSTGYSSPRDTPLTTPVHTPAHTPKASTAALQRKASAFASTKSLARSASRRTARPKKTTGIHYLPNLDEGPRGGLPVQVTAPQRRRDTLTEVKDYFFDSPVATSSDNLVSYAGADYTYVSGSDSEEEDELCVPFDDTVGRVILNINLQVENRFDHIEDVFANLNFEAFLLCDGLIVAVEKVAPFQFPNKRHSSTKYTSFRGAVCRQKGDIEFDLCWLNARPGAAQSQELFREKNFCGTGRPVFMKKPAFQEKYAYPPRVSLVPGLMWSPTMFTSSTDVEGMRTELSTLRDQCREYLGGDSSYDSQEQEQESQDKEEPGSADEVVRRERSQSHSGPTSPNTLSSTPSASSPALLHTPLWTRLSSTELDAPEQALDSLMYASPSSPGSVASSSAVPAKATGGNTWTVVILARTAAPTAWAEEGYPMGFQEIDISAQCAAIMDPVLRPRLSRPPSTYQTPQQQALERSEYVSVETKVTELLGTSSSAGSGIFPEAECTAVWIERADGSGVALSAGKRQTWFLFNARVRFLLFSFLFSVSVW